MSSKKVGEYILEQPIGKGSFSRVFEGKKQGSNQRYAIKMIPNINQNQKPMMELIEKQIEILKKIQHQNIVRLIEIKRTKNNYYLVFEYCEKGDLEKYVHRYYKNGMPEKTAQRLMYQMADAVKTLHERNIVHRDIKLANILVTKDFVAKLSDFGFAKVQENSQMLMKTYCGTPITMAPEIHNHFQYDFKCDIWSLGVITFQLIYNKPPFMPEGNGGILDLVQVITKSPEVKFPSYPPMGQSFKSLIRMSLQKDPQNRLSIQQFHAHEWIQAGKLSNMETQNTVTTAELLRSVAVQDQMEQEQPDSPVLDNKQTDDVEKAVAKRLYLTLQEEIYRVKTEFDRTVSAFNKANIKDQRIIHLRDFLMFKYCQSVRQNIIHFSYKKQEFSIKISDILQFNELIPIVNECQYISPIPTFIQILEQCSNDEKKYGKEQSLNMYKALLKLFPLFRRFNTKVELTIPSYYEVSIRLRDVRKSLLNSSFSDENTNFLSTELKYSNTNEDIAQLVSNLRNLCQQRIKIIESESGTGY